MTSQSASYWHWLNERTVMCDLCPHHCRIGQDKTGICLVRHHIPSKGLVSNNYGLISSIAVDPIEKKPLYHWKPGSMIFSIGSVGCNMSCPFCQNWPISTWHTAGQSSNRSFSLHQLSPEDILSLARNENLDSIAFTYNEPFVGFEFLNACSRKMKGEGFSTVIVSNGLICQDPLLEVIPFIDAANIDLKAFSEDAYKRMGGHLDSVIQTIVSLYRTGVHLELTHLVVPGINDNVTDFEDMVRWIASLSDTIPLHISRYFPNHKWTEPPTSLKLLEVFREKASRYLKFVYMGNVPGESITPCLSCGKDIVVRHGYQIIANNLDKDGKCLFCGAYTGIVI
ncbi:MAG TPA: AmmeMemoRadiSam system radical SAM enzyme [Synergistales bacterium]|nr:AmmeMemoRadiSam system radical SAM enzyme [Synergistales bacterium]